MASASAGSDPRPAAELPAFTTEVLIGYSDIRRFLPDAILRDALYEATLLEVPNVARLHIRRGAWTLSAAQHPSVSTVYNSRFNAAEISCVPWKDKGQLDVLFYALFNPFLCKSYLLPEPVLKGRV
jgi:hypothetical protein